MQNRMDMLVSHMFGQKRTHLGLLKTREQKIKLYIASASLDQAQALIIGFLAANVTTIFYIIQNGSGSISLDHVLALHLTSIVTSSATSFLFSFLMFSVTLLAIALRINPDNIATPFAAMIGDCITMTTFVFFGTMINNHREEHGHKFIYLFIILAFLVSSIFWMCIAQRNPHTRQVLKTGWFSIITAMCFSTTAGYILQNAYSKYPGVANFQPVTAGVGGNLGSIQASRISTYLHKFGEWGVLPANSLLTYLNPLRTYACKEEESVKALILAIMLFPGNIVFLVLIFAISIGNIALWNWVFFFLYLLAAFIHVSILLYVCQLMSRVYWRLKINPDNNTIPILTALGDLFGSLLLMAVFVLMSTFGYQQWENSLQ
uniref:SLC41A/MgtE integral membrane domain-containing protein n=1 Tax=Acrobeloides nanus TaxID=290746 RepID=A0A914EIG6_9BILA